MKYSTKTVYKSANQNVYSIVPNTRELFGFELSVFENVIVPVTIFQFQDMGNENRFLCTFRGDSKRPTELEYFSTCS